MMIARRTWAYGKRQKRIYAQLYAKVLPRA